MTTLEIKTLLIHALNLCCDGGYSPFTDEEEKEMKEFIHNATDINKACEFVERKGLNSYWLRKYLEGKIPIDYDGIHPCDTCSNNEEYLNGGECYCSKLEE